MYASQRPPTTRHLTDTGSLLLQDLGDRLGLKLHMPEGALGLTDEDGNTWFIEITADGQFWIIHSILLEHSNATPEMLLHLLRLNGRIELMKGASICLGIETDTIRLYVALRQDDLNAGSFEAALTHMRQLHSELLRKELHA